MTGKTHLQGGVLVANMLTLTTGLSASSFLVYGVACLGSLLPDIDHPGSKIGRKFPPLAWIIRITCGHRGLFHSPLPYCLLYLFSLALVNARWLFMTNGLFAGILSHLLLDSLTVSGIPLFFPFSQKKVSIASIKTNSPLEWLFASCLLILNIALFISLI